MVLALGICASTLAQVTEKQIDGCAKKCAFCVKNRLTPYHRSCTSCVDSSPKPTSKDPLYFECSGSALPNCQINVLAKDGKLRCERCADDYMKVGEDKCERLTPEYAYCRYGLPVQCQECHSNYIREAG